MSPAKNKTWYTNRMENKKIANILHNASIQPSKFETKNWFEKRDVARGTYNVYSQINFKT